MTDYTQSAKHGFDLFSEEGKLQWQRIKEIKRRFRRISKILEEDPQLGILYVDYKVFMPESMGDLREYLVVSIKDGILNVRNCSGNSFGASMQELGPMLFGKYTQEVEYFLSIYKDAPLHMILQEEEE